MLLFLCLDGSMASVLQSLGGVTSQGDGNTVASAPATATSNQQVIDHGGPDLNTLTVVRDGDQQGFGPPKVVLSKDKQGMQNGKVQGAALTPPKIADPKEKQDMQDDEVKHEPAVSTNTEVGKDQIIQSLLSEVGTLQSEVKSLLGTVATRGERLHALETADHPPGVPKAALS